MNITRRLRPTHQEAPVPDAAPWPDHLMPSAGDPPDARWLRNAGLADPQAIPRDTVDASVEPDPEPFDGGLSWDTDGPSFDGRASVDPGASVAEVLEAASPAYAHPPLDDRPDPLLEAPSPAPSSAAEPSAAPSPESGVEPATAEQLVVAASPTTWQLNTGLAMVQPRSASDVLSTLAHKVAVGSVEQYQPVPLGFTPLDKAIGGGIRAGELLLIGGAQGTGKTTMAMQMARNIVLGGQASVLYICFEHDEEYLLNRLIAMESVLAQLPQKTNGVKLQDVRREILGTWLAQGTENADLSTNPRLRPALERIARYGQNLFLLRGSQTTSTVANMHELIKKYKELSGDRRLVVFVDYMQKVPVIPEPNTETEKVTSIVNGLKDLALSLDVPMISIVAADRDGLKAARLRNHHLRGSSAINYEADIIVILNEKYHIVAKVNIEF
ncbi:MAG: DnaB-like helicase C-terminal domain-containing protein, partial [Candidatus Limnocylindrales bacterium]